MADGLRARLKGGRRRVALAVGPVLLASGVAALAYFLARTVLGQPYPFFAPAAAWISLGFARDRSVRRVAEMALGVSLGVGMGEALASAFGPGTWQIAVAIALGALLARLLDRGALMTTQAGLQAVIVVGLPASLTGGSLGRWTDALLGGALAAVTAVLVPGRSWRRAQVAADKGMNEIAGTLAMLAAALRRGNIARAAEALAHARAVQGELDHWRELAATGREAARFSPVARRHRAEIEELARAGGIADQAMRNTRVVVRRAIVAVEKHGAQPTLGDLVGRISLLAAELGEALRRGGSMAGTQLVLRSVGVDLQPERFPGWRVQALVVVLRSLLVDLLQISGLTYDEAKAELAG